MPFSAAATADGKSPTKQQQEKISKSKSRSAQTRGSAVSACHCQLSHLES
jgi:hypothetical protein